MNILLSPLAMLSYSLLSAVLIIILSVSSSVALECYVCDNQEDNTGKCLTTIKTCEYGEDVCLSEISWGSTPYWQQGALKQYYISKRCSSKDKCAKYRTSLMPLCTHIWYQDWKCSECCKGDRCNYYIISSSTMTQVTKAIVLFTTTASVLFSVL